MESRSSENTRTQRNGKRNAVSQTMNIFDNCIIQSPDGFDLSRCGRKKVKWYLDRGLAEQVSDNPIVIRLKFEPSGRRSLNDPFMLSGKPNVCMVCGTNENLTRHHIVPSSFVRHMSIEYKMDVMKDILALCRPCHNIYEDKSQEKRTQMAEALGVDPHKIDYDKVRELQRVSGAAVALINHKNSIPEPRKSKLYSIIYAYAGIENITDEDLHIIKNEAMTTVKAFPTFSKFYAESVEDYNEFAKSWRIHFVETMNPKHLPEEWKIDRLTQPDEVWVPPRMLKNIS